MSANRLFNALRQRFDIKSDTALAHALDVVPSSICKARAHDSVSDFLILRIHECKGLGLPVKEIRDLAAPDLPTRKTHEPTRERADAGAAAG